MCVCVLELARLGGRNTVPRAGRLEIQYNGIWGTVCEDFFDVNDAKVACNLLGFGYSFAIDECYLPYFQHICMANMYSI